MPRKFESAQSIRATPDVVIFDEDRTPGAERAFHRKVAHDQALRRLRQDPFIGPRTTRNDPDLVALPRLQDRRHHRHVRRRHWIKRSTVHCDPHLNHFIDGTIAGTSMPVSGTER